MTIVTLTQVVHLAADLKYSLNSRIIIDIIIDTYYEYSIQVVSNTNKIME